MNQDRPLLFNHQAADARCQGVLQPDHGQLAPLIRNWSGPQPLRVCSGGTSSRAAADDAWTVDLQAHFNQIDWNPRGQTVWIGAGCRMGDVLTALLPHGRSISAGLSGLPGLGYVISGGMGPLSRQLGLAVDLLREIQGVWGHGEPFHLTRRNDATTPEWRGLCGAAAFLGVVSGVRLTTQPLQPLWIDALQASPEQLPDWMAAAEASPACTSLQWHWGEDNLVRRLLVRSQQVERWQRIEGLHQLPALTAAPPPHPRIHAEVVGLLGPACAERWRMLVPALSGLISKRPHPSCSLACQQLGHATGDVPVGATSFIHRDAIWKPWITAAWPAGDLAARANSLLWLQDMWSLLEQVCPGVHLAQLHDHLPFHQNELALAYGDWLPGLKSLKARLDPDGKLPAL